MSSHESTQGSTQGKQALLDSCLALLSYLEHAAGVARDKFCRFDLVRMALGCMLMAMSVALHLFVVSR